MKTNMIIELTPIKVKKGVVFGNKALTQSLKKNQECEVLLKTSIKRMSYKAISDCLFELAVKQPSTQPVIENYLKKTLITKDTLSLRDLTQDFINSRQDLEERVMLKNQNLTSNSKNNLLESDLAQLQGFCESELKLENFMENFQDERLVRCLRKINREQRKQEKGVFQLEKEKRRLKEKLSIKEDSIKIKKMHIEEYEKENLRFREKIAMLEEMNSSLRINFDRVLQNIESKVNEEKEERYAHIFSDFKKELSQKDYKINEIKKESEMVVEKCKKEFQVKQWEESDKRVNEMNRELFVKEKKLEFLKSTNKDLENLIGTEKEMIQRLERKMEKFKEQVESKDEIISKMEENQKRIENGQDEIIQELKLRLEERASEDEKSNELEEINDELINEKYELEKELEILKDGKEKLVEQMDQVVEVNEQEWKRIVRLKDQEVNGLKKEIDQREGNLVEMSKESQQKEFQLNQMEKEMFGLKSLILELKQEFQNQMENEKYNNQREIDILRNEVISKEQMINQLQNDSERNINILRNDITSKESMIDQLQIDLTQKEREIDHRSKLPQLQEEIQKYTRMVQELHLENSNLHSSLNQSKSKNSKLEKSIDNLKLKISDLEELIEENNSEVSMIKNGSLSREKTDRNSMEEMKREIQDVRGCLSQKHEQIEKVSYKLVELHHKLSNKETDLTNLRRALQETRSELDQKFEENAALSTKNKQLRGDFLEIQQSMTFQQNLLNNLKLEKNKKIEKKVFEQIQADLTSKVSTLQKTITDRELNLKEEQKKIEVFQKELVTRKKRIQKKRKRERNEHKSLIEDFDELIEENQDLEKRRNCLLKLVKRIPGLKTKNCKKVFAHRSNSWIDEESQCILEEVVQRLKQEDTDLTDKFELKMFFKDLSILNSKKIRESFRKDIEKKMGQLVPLSSLKDKSRKLNWLDKFKIAKRQLKRLRERSHLWQIFEKNFFESKYRKRLRKRIKD